jgi:hypothetical protein
MKITNIVAIAIQRGQDGRAGTWEFFSASDALEFIEI